MTCKKCGCEDYLEYKDRETDKWKKECQNCGIEIDVEIEEFEEDWEVEQ